MVRRAVKAKVDAKRNRSPRRILCAAIETYLKNVRVLEYVIEGGH